MDGEIKLLINLDKSIGEKAFVLNVASKVLSDFDETSMKESVDLEQVELKQIDVSKSKILIFED